MNMIVIKTIEKTSLVQNNFEEINLVENDLECIRPTNKKYLYIGLIHITLQSLNRQGMIITVLVAFRYNRHNKFIDSIN